MHSNSMRTTSNEADFQCPRLGEMEHIFQSYDMDTSWKSEFVCVYTNTEAKKSNQIEWKLQEMYIQTQVKARYQLLQLFTTNFLRIFVKFILSRISYLFTLFYGIK